MAGVRITGAEHPIRDIFSERFVFEIPSYQRPYSWTSEHAGVLLDDLLECMPDADADEAEPYFLGSIVLAKAENSARAKVIDGQQRLTTLTILLAALADSLGDKGHQVREFIRQSGNEFAGFSDEMRLRLRDRDQPFFEKYVQTSTGLSGLLALDPTQLANDAQRNIRENARVFADRLDELDPSERNRLARYLAQDCYLIAVSTPDRDSAYRVFAILNDRGLDLSHADIIKSELIGRIDSAEDEDEYTARWEDLEDALGVAWFQDLFSHVRMIYAKEKSRGSVLKEFREHVLDHVSKPEQFIDDVLLPWGDVLLRIREQSWESATHADEINGWLTWLSRIDNSDWLPPAILFMDKYSQQPELIVGFLRGLERLAATMLIRRTNVNKRIERYANLLREIETELSAPSELQALELTDDERTRTRESLDGELYGWKSCRYVLLRLDSNKNAGGANYEHQVISVEHVLPQTPELESAWAQLFSEEERNYWTHRLANLVLLPKKKNSAAKNFDFASKKAKYFAGDGGMSPFLLTMEVLRAERWDPEHLRARQQELLDDAAHAWEL